MLPLVRSCMCKESGLPYRGIVGGIGPLLSTNVLLCRQGNDLEGWVGAQEHGKEQVLSD